MFGRNCNDPVAVPHLSVWVGSAWGLTRRGSLNPRRLDAISCLPTEWLESGQSLFPRYYWFCVHSDPIWNLYKNTYMDDYENTDK